MGRRKLHFKVTYDDSLFSGGTAYIRAVSKRAAWRQCVRKEYQEEVIFRPRSLRQISKAEYNRAQKKAA